MAKKLKTIKFNINEQPDANNEKKISSFFYDGYKRIKSISHNNKTLICVVEKYYYVKALCYGNNKKIFLKK